jgi:hypothetical protein
MKIFSLLIAIIRALDFDDCKYSNTACLAVPKYCKINEESGCTLVIVKNLGREIQINMTRSSSGMALIIDIREKSGLFEADCRRNLDRTWILVRQADGN